MGMRIAPNHLTTLISYENRLKEVETTMKRMVRSCISTLVITLALAAGSALAQSVGTYVADIPFDFDIGNETHEAGGYAFALHGRDYVAPLLRVRDQRESKVDSVFLLKNGRRSTSENTVLVFNRIGSKYFLDEIISPRFGFAVTTKIIQTNLGRRINKPDETVAIVLRQL